MSSFVRFRVRTNLQNHVATSTNTCNGVCVILSPSHLPNGVSLPSHLWSLLISINSNTLSSHGLISPARPTLRPPASRLLGFLLPLPNSAIVFSEHSETIHHKHRAGKRILERTESRRADRGSPKGWALRGQVRDR